MATLKPHQDGSKQAVSERTETTDDPAASDTSVAVPAAADAPASDAQPAVLPPDNLPGITWVGIGASAGGLEALRNFVRNLTSDLPATYIVAQHMAPLHKSMLAEIIGRETDMAVKDVTDGLDPVAGTLYITPPNNNIIVEHDRMHLIDPSHEPASPKPSVDVFFRSLAEHKRSRAVGVVLSGTGSDGADGIRAIREHGGITCAQDLESAKYSSMPQTAVDTGCVDIVMAPDELGKRFAEVLSKPRDLRTLQPVLADGSGLNMLFQLLLERTRVNFRHYKLGTFQRRVERRMAALGVHDLEDYVAAASSSPEEVDALFRDMLITVTSFFRDPEEFERLSTYIRSMVESKRNESIRVWVAGVATGEEAYTIAMLFAEAVADLTAFESLHLQVFATDIDTEAIEVARRGFYAEGLFEHMPRETLASYLDPAPGGFTVKKAVREKVIFSVHNVAQDPPFLNLDMVSCRNLLIYFQAQLQAQVFARFRYALVPHGLLFLGRSETVTGTDGLFRQAGQDKHIFIQRPLTSRKPFNDAVYRPIERPHYKARQQPPGTDSAELAVATAQFDSLVAALGPDGLLISPTMEVRRAYGNVSPFVGIQAGVAVSTSAMALIKEPFKNDIRAAVPAVTGGQVTSRSVAHPYPGDPSRQVRVVVRPISNGKDNESLALVTFEESKSELIDLETLDDGTADSLRPHIDELTRELEIARTSLDQSVEELETSNEELQALNEELQAANEELQSTNEELETSNEELQSTNEELSTVNEELQVSSQQLNAANQSLQSILENVGIPMLVVDRDLNITHVSKAAEPVFQLAPDLVLPHITRCRLAEGMPSLVALLGEAMDDDAHRVDRQVDLEALNATLSVIPHYSSRGTMIGAIILLSDNTDELKRARQELQLIFDSVPVSVMARDADGRILKANAASAEWLGEAQQALTGRSFYDFFVDDVAAELKTRDEAVMASDEGLSNVLQRLVTKCDPDTTRWSRMTHSPSDYPGIDGDVLYSVTEDVTTERETELALALSQLRLDMAIDTSNLGLWDWNPEDNSLYWSDRFLGIVGIDADNFSGDGSEFFDRLHPQDRQRVERVLQDHLTKGTPYAPGFRLRHEDGHYIWIEAHGQARLNEQNEVERVVGTVEDVTEKRQNVHVLRERNRTLDLAQHLSGVGYWKIDLVDNSLYWSEQIYEIHGLEPTEYQPELEHAIERYHKDDIPMIRSRLDDVLHTEGRFEFEGRLFRPDGDLRVVQCVGQSEAGPDGTIVSVFGVFRDITELREREQALRQTLEELSRSNEELNRFSYVCSHDMKEPVRIIESMSQLLLEPDIGQDETQRRELVLRISRNMARLKATIDSLLAYSRLEAKVEQTEIDLNQIVAEVVDILGTVIEEKAAVVDVSDLPVMTGARVHFQQLFQNLIGNALKYSDKSEPQIRISARQSDHGHRLLIEDNGPGIPEESIADIFKVFSRLTLHSDIEGSGLGLAICQRIVSQYRGTIECKPSVLGGAAFHVRLPRDDAGEGM